MYDEIFTTFLINPFLGFRYEKNFISRRKSRDMDIILKRIVFKVMLNSKFRIFRSILIVPFRVNNTNIYLRMLSFPTNTILKNCAKVVIDLE